MTSLQISVTILHHLILCHKILQQWIALIIPKIILLTTIMPKNNNNNNIICFGAFYMSCIVILSALMRANTHYLLSSSYSSSYWQFSAIELNEINGERSITMMTTTNNNHNSHRWTNKSCYCYSMNFYTHVWMYCTDSAEGMRPYIYRRLTVCVLCLQDYTESYKKFFTTRNHRTYGKSSSLAASCLGSSRS